MSSLSGLNELEQLVLYIQDRVREFDSALDTAPGTPFYSQVIQPLLNRLGPDPYDTPLRRFLISRLKAEFPDLILQDGEPLDDYAIKPMQMMIEPFRRQIRQISNNQSLADPTILNDSEADKLGANYFVRRRVGGYSVGLARLYYSAPQAALVTPNNLCADSEGHKFIPIGNQAITADNMLFNVEGNLYYFDVVTRSESQGEAYNIPANTLVSIEGATSVVKVTNKSSFEEGSNKENTVTFVTRVENSLTEKSLVTLRGITARVLEIFDVIRLVQVIGYGDVEMMRDIITGNVDTPTPYAYFLGDVASLGPEILISNPTNNILGKDGTLHDTFVEVGVLIGNLVRYVDVATGAITEHTVTAVATGALQVTPDVAGGISGGTFHLFEDTPGITLSSIPGGILVPNTPQGELRFDNDTVHIGGMLDVYVRAGAPEVRSTTLEGILDGSPLHFGTDLETFGDSDDVFIQVTESVTNIVMRTGKDRFGVALAENNEVLVQQFDPSTLDAQVVPWKPTSDDVGRYIQILNSGRQALLEILEVLSEEYTTLDTGLTKPVRVVRIKLGPPGTIPATTLFNQETGGDYVLGTALAFDTTVRLVEKVSVKSRVRDRDGSRVVLSGSPVIYSGADFKDLGVDHKSAKIGDSTVLETGDDAGIYSIRRILSWLNTNDTLILDRDLTRNVIPSGIGNGSGVRYRVADELNVDLVSPRITKIPLGGIFNGDDLNTVAGSAYVNNTGTTSYLLAGVEANDTLEIWEGDNKGAYNIKSVTSFQLQLDAALLNTEFSASYTIYKAFTGVDRPLVRVKEIELLDSNSQPTGIKIPYGDNIDARVLGAFSNRAEGLSVESYTGQTRDNGVGQYDLYDREVNFVLEGLTAGYRLNIQNTDNLGAYTVIAVGTGDGLVDDFTLRVAPESAGGVEFPLLSNDVHYSIGLPSAGFCRLYFLEPTTVEIQTGLSGGRLLAPDTSGGGEFRFSEVAGYSIIPAAGSDEGLPRDLRVVRSWETTTPGEFRSILEFTNPDRPGVFELEIQDDDVINVYEKVEPRAALPSPIAVYDWDGTTTVLVGHTAHLEVGFWIRKTSDNQWFQIESIVLNTSVNIVNPEGLTIPSGGMSPSDYSATFQELGIFGTPAGLRTIAGSAQVSIPDNSLMDFQVMNDIRPIVGAGIFIDSGPDAGEYQIEGVINSKTLRLNKVMTATTESIVGYDINAREVTTQLIQGTPDVDLYDPGDPGGIGSSEGQFITIFESTRADVDGTYEIKAYISPGRVTLKDLSAPSVGSTYQELDLWEVGAFTWLRTVTDNNVEQPFSIYRAVPTETVITQVATKRDDPLPSVYRGNIPSGGGPPYLTLESDAGLFVGSVIPGDLLEVLTGGAKGVYPIAAVGNGGGVDYVNIASHVTHTFPVAVGGVPFRVWAGLHGSRRMVTVGPLESDNGNIPAGAKLVYRVIRPKVYRFSSTAMQNQNDGLLYFTDIQVESQGAGDLLNLTRGARMQVISGLAADGYTYQVDNNVLTFSPYEQVSLTFDRRFLPVGNSDSPENLSEVSGRNLKVAYEMSTNARLVDELMRSETERPINANPMARHFLPSYVFIQLQYQNGLDANEVGTEIEDYINHLGAEDELEVSDLEAFLTRRGATSVVHPISLATVTHDLDRKLIVNRTENKLGGNQSVPFSGTGRISAFFATLGEGLQVVKLS